MALPLSSRAKAEIMNPKPEMSSGDVAQLGERRVCNAEVAGSIPVVSTFSFV